MRIVGIIPARMAASRFPGKPLARIAGRTMIEHVYRRSQMNPRFSEVCIATCDEEIVRASAAFGCRAIMTSAAHQRGTDRVAEAASHLSADVFVNIQGDEPLIQPGIFDELLRPFDENRGVDCSNLMAELTTPEEQDNLNNVKVVTDLRGRALYFSREPIPSRRMRVTPKRVYRQIGIFAFRAGVLADFVRLPQTPHEQAESCDMMRLIEHGYTIHMVATSTILQSVDTPEDLREAERLMAGDPLFASYASV
jgi:3-deoxy-manno-octulosonate cytidylyltransferase (CMP-KDO synthetase)